MLLLGGNSLEVQQLGLQAFPTLGTGLIPGQGTKIPQAVWHGQKKKRKINNSARCELFGGGGVQKSPT